MFAAYSIRHHRNYGVRVTSRTESAHAGLKKFLLSRNTDLNELHKAVFMFKDRLEARYREKLFENQKIPRFSQQHTLYKYLRTKISRQALERLDNQRARAQESLEHQTALPACTGTFSQQFGLPCQHFVKEKLFNQSPLQLREIDRHWHLRRSEPLPEDEERILEVQEPIIRPKRRQGNRHDTSTKRIRSHDELYFRKNAAPRAAVSASPAQNFAAHPPISAAPLHGHASGQRRPPHCTDCGGEGHKRTSRQCPAKKAIGSQ